MTGIDILRWFASLVTIAAALSVASNISNRVSFWGFIAFSVASLTWIAIGVLDDKPALTLQNIALTFVNVYGIHRYWPFNRSEN